MTLLNTKYYLKKCDKTKESMKKIPDNQEKKSIMPILPAKLSSPLPIHHNFDNDSPDSAECTYLKWLPNPD